jgi:O-succinylbenzoate synthase
MLMQAVKIETVTLRLVRLPLAEVFRTRIGEASYRECIILSIQGEGIEGWGECIASQLPDDLSISWGLYSYETNKTAWHILSELLIPTIIGKKFTEISELVNVRQRVRGHPMACAALELALWDILARGNTTSVARMLNLGELNRPRVEVGVSISIQKTDDLLAEKVLQYIEEGYKRIKCKIEPNRDIAMMSSIRTRFPHLTLMVDANGSYSPKDFSVFQALADLDLIMIEQPFSYDNILDHARLQSRSRTRICLDESIHSLELAKIATKLAACQAINIKPGRVGGLWNARQIHDLCMRENVPVWCGGMLETGIGRAANIALSTLPGFLFPGDISASSRYYSRDIARPPFELNQEDSTISVPDKLGLGVEIDLDYLESITSQKAVFTVNMKP